MPIPFSNLATEDLNFINWREGVILHPWMETMFPNYNLFTNVEFTSTYTVNNNTSGRTYTFGSGVVFQKEEPGPLGIFLLKPCHFFLERKGPFLGASVPG